MLYLCLKDYSDLVTSTEVTLVTQKSSIFWLSAISFFFLLFLFKILQSTKIYFQNEFNIFLQAGLLSKICVFLISIIL